MQLGILLTGLPEIVLALMVTLTVVMGWNKRGFLTFLVSYYWLFYLAHCVLATVFGITGGTLMVGSASQRVSVAETPLPLRMRCAVLTLRATEYVDHAARNGASRRRW